jgi:septal ring factor EnvC (AmiA/AmiB activator)
LEKESLGRGIDSFIAPSSATKDAPPPRPEIVASWKIDDIAAQKEELNQAQREAEAHSAVVRREIQDGKAHIAKLRASLAKRRSDYASATHQLNLRRATMLESVQKSTRRVDHRWNSVHKKSIEARAFLCREAANLYGLKQRRRRKSGDVYYAIGGVGIVDLRDMNSRCASC